VNGQEDHSGKKKSEIGNSGFRRSDRGHSVIQLSGLDEKVNECGSGECGFDWMKKLFIHCDFGLVGIGVMSRMCWLLLAIVIGD
jgi:hypothetical protein